MKLEEMYAAIKTEEKARIFVKQNNLMVFKAPLCFKCGSKLIFVKRKGIHDTFCCSRKKQMKGVGKRVCFFKISCKKFSFFGDLNSSFSIILKVLYYFCLKLSYREIAYELSIDKKTVVSVIKKLLNKVKLHFKNKVNAKIRGAGFTVEIDESHITTRKYHVGRVLRREKVWIVGGKCRETKECFFVSVNQRNSVILKNIILKFVAPDSLVITDMCAATMKLRASDSNI